jgi:hypothetical protein
MARKNAFYAQSGGVSAVINASGLPAPGAGSSTFQTTASEGPDLSVGQKRAGLSLLPEPAYQTARPRPLSFGRRTAVTGRTGTRTGCIRALSEPGRVSPRGSRASVSERANRETRRIC